MITISCKALDQKFQSLSASLHHFLQWSLQLISPNAVLTRQDLPLAGLVQSPLLKFRSQTSTRTIKSQTTMWHSRSGQCQSRKCSKLSPSPLKPQTGNNNSQVKGKHQNLMSIELTRQREAILKLRVQLLFSNMRTWKGCSFWSTTTPYKKRREKPWRSSSQEWVMNKLRHSIRIIETGV